MGYIKADKVLPEEILLLVQEYIDGEFLYIPRKQGEKKSWGEKNGTKRELHARNDEIYGKYTNGISIASLASEYCLSRKSIERIIYTLKGKS
ncbi:CD3324 family protein [Bacillus alkalicellulosilyticus]|uniref:CD3324 family protein n=1 Tax=Alkalihalobacterium alkalicellulosilyticum TaxID=1912214 RepID=UPI000998C2EE|nr:CD3324 family protein [Bacillus alkalicellulosilyticus]